MKLSFATAEMNFVHGTLILFLAKLSCTLAIFQFCSGGIHIHFGEIRGKRYRQKSKKLFCFYHILENLTVFEKFANSLVVPNSVAKQGFHSVYQINLFTPSKFQPSFFGTTFAVNGDIYKTPL